MQLYCVYLLFSYFYTQLSETTLASAVCVSNKGRFSAAVITYMRFVELMMTSSAKKHAQVSILLKQERTSRATVPVHLNSTFTLTISCETCHVSNQTAGVKASLDFWLCEPVSCLVCHTHPSFSEWILCTEWDVPHPEGLSGSLLSAHLKVTLLAHMGGPAVATGLLAFTGETGEGFPRCSSSTKRSRKEQEEGGDWTAVDLMTQWCKVSEELTTTVGQTSSDNHRFQMTQS